MFSDCPASIFTMCQSFLLSSIHCGTETPGNSGSATPSHLLSFLIRHLHTSSNLHEELHHSFFLYLLMGHRNFVGLPEYASCLFFLVVPLFLLFLVMYNATMSRSGRDIDNNSDGVINKPFEADTSSMSTNRMQKSSYEGQGQCKLHVYCGIWVVLVDLFVAGLVCVIGYVILCEQSSSFARFKLTGISPVKDAVSVAFAMWESIAYDLDIRRSHSTEIMWLIFSSVSCLAYFLYIIVSSVMVSCSNHDAVFMKRRESVLRGGNEMALLFFLTVLLSVMSMHHSVLSFSVVLPLVPAMFVYVLLMTTTRLPWLARPLLLAASILVSPPVLVFLFAAITGDSVQSDHFSVLGQLLSGFVNEVSTAPAHNSNYFVYLQAQEYFVM